jgi:hypothetical protein
VRFLSRFRRNRPLRTEFSALPVPSEEVDPERRDYALLASGLARLLASCSPSAIERELAVSLQAYRALKVQIGKGTAVLPAAVLNDLSHEIALCADRTTLHAALRCLQRRVRQDPMRAPLPA